MICDPEKEGEQEENMWEQCLQMPVYCLYMWYVILYVLVAAFLKSKKK